MGDVNRDARDVVVWCDFGDTCKPTRLPYLSSIVHTYMYFLSSYLTIIINSASLAGKESQKLSEPGKDSDMFRSR